MVKQRLCGDISKTAGENAKITKPTLYIPKGNIKKSNKTKKDVDKASRICYYPIVARQENEN